MNEALEKYMDANNLWNMEGERGVRRFEQVIREVCGYSDLHAFLVDNPGALSAMADFVGEWVDRNSEWKDNLKTLGFSENEDDEDDE